MLEIILDSPLFLSLHLQPVLTHCSNTAVLVQSLSVSAFTALLQAFSLLTRTILSSRALRSTVSYRGSEMPVPPSLEPPLLSCCTALSLGRKIQSFILWNTLLHSSSFNTIKIPFFEWITRIFTHRSWLTFVDSSSLTTNTMYQMYHLFHHFSGLCIFVHSILATRYEPIPALCLDGVLII